MNTHAARSAGAVCRVAAAWGVVCASLALAQPADLSFEQLGTGLAIPVGRVGPNGEQWGSGWSGAPCASRDVTPDAGSWVGGTISRSEDYCWGWKVTPSGTFFAIIKDRGSMTQAFTAALTTRAALTWLESNRASWRNVDWYGRPNTYAVALVDQLGAVQDLGTYQSEVAGGNSWSTPPGDGWWTDVGKRSWQTRTSPPFTLVAGRGYTLRFDSLAPFWYLPDGGLGGVDDRSTFIDGIVLTVGLDAGAIDAGAIDAGAVDAGAVDAGAVDAGAVDAGAVDAGAVDAGAVDAGDVDAGAVDAGDVDAGDVDAGPSDGGTAIENGGAVSLLPDSAFQGGGCACSSPGAGSLLAFAGLISLVRRRRPTRR